MKRDPTMYEVINKNYKYVKLVSFYHRKIKVFLNFDTIFNILVIVFFLVATYKIITL